MLTLASCHKGAREHMPTHPRVLRLLVGLGLGGVVQWKWKNSICGQSRCSVGICGKSYAARKLQMTHNGAAVASDGAFKVQIKEINPPDL